MYTKEWANLHRHAGNNKGNSFTIYISCRTNAGNDNFPWLFPNAVNLLVPMYAASRNFHVSWRFNYKETSRKLTIFCCDRASWAKRMLSWYLLCKLMSGCHADIDRLYKLNLSSCIEFSILAFWYLYSQSSPWCYTSSDVVGIHFPVLDPLCEGTKFHGESTVNSFG